MKTMKAYMITLVALITCATSYAADIRYWQPMQSTSAMQATGSMHQAKVTAVDAPQAQYTYLQMQSTSIMMETGEIPTPFSDEEEGNGPKGNLRRGFDHGAESGQSDESPIGEPWVLLLFAAATAATIAIRHRRTRVRQIVLTDATLRH